MSELFIMKTHEELKQIKAECQALAAKLKELSDDELKEVTGGLLPQAGIPGLENIGPYAMVCGIPLDSDSKLKS